VFVCVCVCVAMHWQCSFVPNRPRCFRCY